MPFVRTDKTEKVDTKTVKEVKQQLKDDLEMKNLLYGAGQSGWTKEWYNRIVDAFEDNQLSIGEVRANYEWRGEYPQYYSDVKLLLASHKSEEELTDAERLLLMIYCHPVQKVKTRI